MNIRENPELRSYTDEFTDRLQVVADELDEKTNGDLALSALHSIMKEQERTADRSPGWPSDEHRATRLVLEERTKR